MILVPILQDDQDKRDLELSNIVGINIDKIKKMEIASPDSIRVFGGNEEPKNKEDIVNLYRNYKDLNLIAYLRTLMFTSIKRRHKNLFKLINEAKDKVCLDFGSGVGTHAIAALQSGCKSIDLLDVDGPLIHFAQKRIEKLGYEAGFLNHDCELKDNNYDLVICSDVLEHVHDPIAELKRIHKSMKSGGKIHLLVSLQEKNSSGHFHGSIQKWKSCSNKILGELFIKSMDTIYIKK